MKVLNAADLIAACGDQSLDAGIRIETSLEPLAGPSGRVKPAIYIGGSFQLGRRWWGAGPDRSVVEVITIDNEPSQANRIEAALERGRSELGLPELVLDLSELEPLPAHVLRRISSFRFPHRNADAYLRDALVEGAEFLKSEVGVSIFEATADNADALMQWLPQALLFGFWQSHLGKKGSHAKLARSWVSEIVGLRPAADDVRTLGLKGDPLNLSAGGKIAYDEAHHADWDIADKGKNLSDIGHGQVPVGGDDAATLSAVSFEQVVQQSSVSFAGLRNIHTTTASAHARAVLVALGLVGHCAAFGGAFQLRSGADLRPTSTKWTWLGSNGDVDLDPLTLDQAVDLFHEVVGAAEAEGLRVGSAWPTPLILTPKPNLAKVIRETFPVPAEA